MSAALDLDRRTIAPRSIAEDLAELIVDRALAGLDCPPRYLQTLGYAEATLAEHLPAAEELARVQCDVICRELEKGIRK